MICSAIHISKSTFLPQSFKSPHLCWLSNDCPVRSKYHGCARASWRWVDVTTPLSNSDPWSMRRAMLVFIILESCYRQKNMKWKNSTTTWLAVASNLWGFWGFWVGWVDPLTSTNTETPWRERRVGSEALLRQRFAEASLRSDSTSKWRTRSLTEDDEDAF